MRSLQSNINLETPTKGGGREPTPQSLLTPHTHTHHTHKHTIHNNNRINLIYFKKKKE